MKMQKLSKEVLSLAGEYAVASELCKRGLYSQITLGNHKRTDILVETELRMLRIQVKAKQVNEWPSVAGLYRPDDFLILVDYVGKNEDDRPDFFILNLTDWEQIMEEELKKHPEAKIDEQNRITYYREKNGQSYVDWKGLNIKPNRVAHAKDQWQKITSRIDPAATEA